MTAVVIKFRRCVGGGERKQSAFVPRSASGESGICRDEKAGEEEGGANLIRGKEGTRGGLPHDPGLWRISVLGWVAGSVGEAESHALECVGLLRIRGSVVVMDRSKDSMQLTTRRFCCWRVRRVTAPANSHRHGPGSAQDGDLSALC